VTRPAAAGSDQLTGLKAAELAHVVAGPMAESMLADQGADVVHVELPGTGDSARAMGPVKDEITLWFKVPGRNKRSVTLDLNHGKGQALARRRGLGGRGDRGHAGRQARRVGTWLAGDSPGQSGGHRAADLRLRGDIRTRGRTGIREGQRGAQRRGP
jgi:hypothetical protein